MGGPIRAAALVGVLALPLGAAAQDAREVERLRARVSQLEAQLAAERGRKARPEEPIPPVRVELIGRVRTSSAARLDVLDEERNTFQLEVDPSTRLVGEGRSVAELAPGTTVRVSFDLEDGRSQAREVEVLRPDSPEAKELDEVLSNRDGGDNL